MSRAARAEHLAGAARTGAASPAALERTLRATGLLMMAAYVLAVVGVFPKVDGRIVFGDATHHFVQLRSMVFDQDLHFRNEYVHIYGLDGYVPGTEWIFTDLTPTGHVRNYMPVGPALLAAPLYVVVALVAGAGSLLGLNATPDGYGRLFQLTPGIAGVLAATLAALVSFRLACRFLDPWSSGIGVLATWIGSHALYYSLVSPAYSHTASMFACALFFSHWIRTRESPSLPRLALWGALGGFAALMRWQEAVLLAIPMIEAARWATDWPRRLLGMLAAAAAFVLAFSPQMIVWAVLYGQPFAIPQGSSFMQWTSPHLLDVLWSDSHGLFSWAPMLLLSMVGLVSVLRSHPPIALPIAVICLLTWYVNASVADWWGGEAFGARRFLSLFPLFSLGLAAWVAPGLGGGRVAWRAAALVALTASNWLLLLQYQLYMKRLTTLAPYPDGWPDMWLTRFVIPFRLLRSWLL